MTGIGLQSPRTMTGSIAARFVRARLTAQPLREYPGTVPTDSRVAYAIQEEAIDLWPDVIAGWKVARIPPDWSNFPEPRLNGPVFSRNVHFAAGSTVPACPVFVGGFAAVETEIVIRVGADAPACKLTWSLDEALEYIGSVHIGIEVASSPLATLNDLGPGAVISDFGNNWGVVVGREIEQWRTLDTIHCETFLDGAPVGAREVEMKSGPLTAFAFTLGHCAMRGRPLKAGAWITTGMITGVHAIRAGQQSCHVFSGVGAVSCRTIPAQPFE